MRQRPHGAARSRSRSIRERSVLPIAFVVLLVASAVPAPATHNSAGAEAAVVHPDEFDRDDGARRPDVPDEARPTFHGNLADPRLAPRDQSGKRYGPPDCDRATWFGWRVYEDALRSGEACYVGYIDVQWAYVVPGSWADRWWGDPAYPSNPHPDDGYCTGQEGPREHPQIGLEFVDQLVASAVRRNDPECSGDAHDSSIGGDVLVDTDIAETAIGDEHGPGASDLTGTETYSGTQSLPLMVRPVVFLFGQPHPDNPRPSEFEAGVGVFGPNPVAGGSPIGDLTGACGERTRECRLLTPYDLKLYDRRYEDLDIDRQRCDPDDGDGELGCLPARACSYLPQFTYQGARPSHTGPCGPLGHRFEFDETVVEGGAGVYGGPPTWASNLPGWKGRWYLMPRGEVAGTLQGARGLLESEAMPEGLVHVAAVNPTVPRAVGPRWCVRPNVLTTAPGGVRAEDARYEADAIDVDLYRRASHAAFEDADELDGGALERPWRQAREAAREAVPDSAEHLLGPPLRAAESASERADPSESDRSDEDDQLPFTRTYNAGYRCRSDGQLVRADDEATVHGGVEMDAVVEPATVTLKDPTKLDHGDGLVPAESDTDSTPWQPAAYTFEGEMVGYLDRNGDGDTDPCAVPGSRPQPSRDRCVWRPIWDAYNPNCEVGWTRCAEVLRADGNDVEEGVGLAFTWKVRGPAVVAPREPVDEMPSADAWTEVRVPDESEAGRTLDPFAARCRPPAEAYAVGLWLRPTGYTRCPVGAGTSRNGPAALPSGAWAGAGTEGDGAEVDAGAGVGAGAVDERTLRERTRVVGLGDVTAMNCVVGTSYGLVDRLVATTGAEDGKAVAKRLCGDVSGRVVLIRDAFKDQNPRLGGTFRSAIRLVKLKPGTKTVDDAEEQLLGFEEPEPLTVKAFLATDDERWRPTRDTLDNVRLEDRSIADLEPTLSDRDLLEPERCVEPDAGREDVTEQEVGAPDVDGDDMGDCWASEYAEMLGEELEPLWDLDCDTLNNAAEFRWETIPIYDVPTRYAFDHCGRALRGHVDTHEVVFADGRDLDMDYMIDGYEARYLARDHGYDPTAEVGDLPHLAPYHPLNDADADGDGTRDLEDTNSDSQESDANPKTDTIRDGIETWLLGTFPSYGDSDCSRQVEVCHDAADMSWPDDEDSPSPSVSDSRGTGDGLADHRELYMWLVDFAGGRAPRDRVFFEEPACHDDGDPGASGDCDEIDNALLDPNADGDGVLDADECAQALQNGYDVEACEADFHPSLSWLDDDVAPGQPADGGLVDGPTFAGIADRWRSAGDDGVATRSTSASGQAPCPSPRDPDSDGDGLLDGMEMSAGTDPCDPASGVGLTASLEEGSA